MMAGSWLNRMCSRVWDHRGTVLSVTVTIYARKGFDLATLNTMTVGKWRRLQQCAGPQHTFAVLAIDHRGPLRRSLEAESPEGSSGEALTAVKHDIVRHLAPATSAILLDPETSAGQCVAQGSLPGSTGLMVALDTGSTGDPLNRSTDVMENWSVEKTLRMGASGVKLLLYYHPESPEAAKREQLVQQVARDCTKWDIPFFMEPLGCAADGSPRPLAPEQRRRVVIESARRLVPLGADILKAEFPVDVNVEPDEAVWREACEELTEASQVPWVLLSGGVTYDTFLKQVRVACEAGASGVMVGRSVWKEAVTLDRGVRNSFLQVEGYERMRKLQALTEALARPFTEVYDVPALGYDWYV